MVTDWPAAPSAPLHTNDVSATSISLASSTPSSSRSVPTSSFVPPAAQLTPAASGVVRRSESCATPGIPIVPIVPMSPWSPLSPLSPGGPVPPLHALTRDANTAIAVVPALIVIPPRCRCVSLLGRFVVDADDRDAAGLNIDGTRDRLVTRRLH